MRTITMSVATSRRVASLCCFLVLLAGGPVAASAAPNASVGSGPAGRVAELDPTVIFRFPAAPLYVEPGQSWMLPIGLNEDVGGRPALLQKRIGGRWVTVKRTRAAKGRLLFDVKEKRAGVFSYRLVVPQHGTFEARTSKVQTVRVEPLSEANRQFFVPTTLSGTFTGTTRAWDTDVMSWSGNATFALASPYEQGGMVSQGFYRPTAVSVAWKVDYRDWRDCHFEGGGALGLNDVTFEVISGAPQEIIAPLGRPDEYDFRLTHQWDQPLLVGTVTCPGQPPVRQEFTNSMGRLFETGGRSFVNNFRLQYVDGYPSAGWIKIVGRTDPADESIQAGMNSWDLTASGTSPLLRPAR
jgi:hypothetical protein